MARGVHVRTGRAPPCTGADLLFSVWNDGIYGWPGAGGPTTVDAIAPVTFPSTMVYFRGTNCIYYFRQAPSGNDTQIWSLNMRTCATNFVTSFQYLPVPCSLGGSSPTPPFPADITSPSPPAITFPTGMYSEVLAAEVVGTSIYLGCEGQGLSSFIGANGASSLVRFDPYTGTTALVGGPFQPLTFRNYLFGLPATPVYRHTAEGYYGDLASTGFVTHLGGTVYWGTGAQIFSSADGFAAPIYDGLGQTNYLSNALTYSRFGRGVIDPVSGNYLFGATKQGVMLSNIFDVGGDEGFAQAEPLSVFDASATTSLGPADFVPTLVLAAGLHSQSSPAGFGDYRVPIDLGLIGYGTMQAMSRCILALSPGGGISVVYDDANSDPAINRSMMGALAIAYNGTDPSAGIGAVCDLRCYTSPVTPVEPTYFDSGGWAPDGISAGVFGPLFDGSIAAVVPFGYQGQLYALQATGFNQLGMAVRSGGGAWSAMSLVDAFSSSSITVPHAHPHEPQYTVISTNSRIKV